MAARATAPRITPVEKIFFGERATRSFHFISKPLTTAQEVV
jgi:hypothetical protein